MNRFEIKEKDNRNMETICNVSKFNLQIHQRFLKKYFHSGVKNKRLLLFHGLGSGKTCSAISIAENFKNPSKKIIFIASASLLPNIYKELLGDCGKYGKSVMNNHDIPNPCSKEVKEAYQMKARQSINKYYDIMSYQQFVSRSKKNTLKINNRLIIIDEVQNIISEIGDMYSAFHKELVAKRPKNINLLLLSGTPMFDKASELGLISNLLNDVDSQLPVGKEFDKAFFNFTTKKIINEDRIISVLKNKISHFRGISPNAYPSRTNRIVACPMSGHQLKGYNMTIGDADMLNNNMSQAFLISPRQASNLVYPNGKVGVKGKRATKNSKIDFEKCSTKFYNAARIIDNSVGPVFVYSNFVSACGIDDFSLLLLQKGYQEVTKDICPLKKGLRFARFQSGQSEENTRILNIFNSRDNRNGHMIKAILGSPAMKEGVTLLRVSEVHLLDPYWNRSRTEQIIGRAIRFCSHKDMPKTRRRVNVYNYIAYPDVSGTSIPKMYNVRMNNSILNQIPKTVSIDFNIYRMAFIKQQNIDLFESLLKNISIDCDLFKPANEIKKNTIDCFKYEKDFNKNVKVSLNNLNDQNNQNVPPPPKMEKKPKKKNISVPKANMNNIPSVQKPKRKPKKLNLTKQYKAKTETVRKRKTKNGCPINRIPDDDGNCPLEFKYKYKNPKGQICCYKKRQRVKK